MNNPKRYYSDEFRKKVVLEVLSGKLTKEQAKTKYGIKGNSAVLNWIRQYEYDKRQNKEEERAIKKKDPLALERRIKELERECEDANLKAELYEEMIKEAEKRMGLEIRKK
jgi:transposase